MPDPGVVCPVELIGPQSTWSPPRRTVSWSLLSATDAGASGPDAGASRDAGDTSGCTSISAIGALPGAGGAGDVACRGTVVVRRAGGDFDLVFADGSILRWDTTVSAPVVAVPALTDGQTASVDYSRQTTVVCPFCGSYQTILMQIRTADAGPLIWIGREGPKLAEVTPALVQELFGLGSRAEPVCQSTFSAGCWTVTRQVFDHVLPTSPEQVIPAASSRHITTVKGEYEVFWTHSTETSLLQMNCADGPDPATDNSFAASRTAAPLN